MLLPLLSLPSLWWLQLTQPRWSAVGPELFLPGASFLCWPAGRPDLSFLLSTLLLFFLFLLQPQLHFYFLTSPCPCKPSETQIVLQSVALFQCRPPWAHLERVGEPIHPQTLTVLHTQLEGASDVCATCHRHLSGLTEQACVVCLQDLWNVRKKFL